MRDVLVTLLNDLCVMWYLLYKYASVTKESVHVCIETAAHGFTLV